MPSKRYRGSSGKGPQRPSKAANVTIIDGRAHMMGRLASTIAKEMLQGNKVVVVRCEQIVISGSMTRNKVKMAQFFKKRTNTNPKRGPFHHRSPAKHFYRVVRGMIPHKTRRGECAMSRIKVFEGCPAPYDKMKKMVVPNALKVMRLAPGRRCCILGDLCTEYGWKHAALVERLEAKRKIKGKAFYEAKKAKIKAAYDKAKDADLSSVAALAQYGY